AGRDRDDPDGDHRRPAPGGGRRRRPNPSLLRHAGRRPERRDRGCTAAAGGDAVSDRCRSWWKRGRAMIEPSGRARLSSNENDDDVGDATLAARFRRAGRGERQAAGQPQLTVAGGEQVAKDGTVQATASLLAYQHDLWE